MADWDAVLYSGGVGVGGVCGVQLGPIQFGDWRKLLGEQQDLLDGG